MQLSASMVLPLLKMAAPILPFEPLRALRVNVQLVRVAVLVSRIYIAPPKLWSDAMASLSVKTQLVKEGVVAGPVLRMMIAPPALVPAVARTRLLRKMQE